MSLAEFCTTFVMKDGDANNILHKNIVEFIDAPWGLGLGLAPDVPPLHPVQKFILKAYYGLPMDGSSNRNIIIKDKFNQIEMYRFNEIEYMRYLYEEGRINVSEIKGPFQNLELVCGRRLGKTLSTSCIITYEIYKLLNFYSPQEYYKIMPESEIRITCLATSKETASELYNNITGQLLRAEFFRKYRNERTQTSMSLRTQRDIDKYGPNGRSSFSVHIAPCSAKGLIGHSNIVVALDEMAFFFDDERRGSRSKDESIGSGSDRNDRAIYEAVTPSVAGFKGRDGTPHGKIICLSSPNAKSGKFYEEYERSFEENAKDLLMIQAPTWEGNPSISTEYLINKYNANPVVFNSMYGAQFSDRVKGWIEDPTIVRQNIVPGLRYKESSSLRVPHFAGFDIGSKRDGIAVCVCHFVKEMLDGVSEEMLEVDVSTVRYASDEGKDYFKPQDIIDWIESFTKKFYIVKGLFDQWGEVFLKSAVLDKGMKQFEFRSFNETSNSDNYQNLLSNLISSKIRLPEQEVITDGKIDKDSDLVRELLTLQSYQKGKYVITVEAPDRKGAHDDLSDAFARAILVATEYKNKGFASKVLATSASRGLGLQGQMRTLEIRKAELGRPSSGFMNTLNRGNGRGGGGGPRQSYSFSRRVF